MRDNYASGSYLHEDAFSQLICSNYAGAVLENVISPSSRNKSKNMHTLKTRMIFLSHPRPLETRGEKFDYSECIPFVYRFRICGILPGPRAELKYLCYVLVRGGANGSECRCAEFTRNKNISVSVPLQATPPPSCLRFPGI